MSLLDQEVKKEEPKGKKIVLLLLIFCIFALIITIVMMMAVSGKETQTLTMSINGTDIIIEEGLFTTNQNGVEYISIQKIAKLIGYNYLTGEYKQYNEDTTNTKCYLESSNQVIQFEADTDKIYKINPTSNLDYEEYELNNKILKQNNLLYVAVEDVNVALNAIYSLYNNVITLNTAETLYLEKNNSIQQETNNELVRISDNPNNKKAIAYGMLIVENESGKWGVVSSIDFSTIIGNKYSSIEFIESAGAFIVSDNNKYGVISKERLIIDLNYEKISVISNNPLCYEVKLGQKIAIVDGEGNAITNNSYNSVGYVSKNASEESVLVIKELDGTKVNLLVVCKDGKYGLIDLEDRSLIVECELDKIYLKNEGGKKIYYVQLYGQERVLEDYIESINTTTINVGE